MPPGEPSPEPPTPRPPDPNAERVLVCVGPGPGSARVVRAAHRLAADLGAPWIAANVGGGTAEALELAATLGAEVVRLPRLRVAAALVAVARERGVSRIVLGKPTHPPILDRVRGSLVDAVIRGSGPIPVQVIGGEPPSPVRRPRPSASAVDHGVALLAVAATTALALLGTPVLAAPDVVMLYLLAISAVAYRSGRSPGLLAAAASVGAYNFFFVQPVHTLAVDDLGHLLTFAVMFGVGLAISTFAERTRARQADGLERERRIAALYELTRDLAAAADEPALVEVVRRHAPACVGASGRLVSAGADGVVVDLDALGLGPSDRDAVIACAQQRLPTGRGASVAAEARVHCRPVPTAGEGAVLVFAGEREVDPEQADVFARQVALALGRVRLAARAEAAAVHARAEEMRSALLSTVSHDLRTPLAGITGAATTLVDAGDRLSEGRRLELAEGIRDEAERLERLVRNLLDMTRVASGSLEPRREWVPLEELVESALRRAARAVEGHPVEVHLAPELPLLPVDPVLFEQALSNLLENAGRHTPTGTTITVAGRVAPGGVEVEVADRGPGLPEGDPERLFEPFVGRPGGGSGLGLAICRGVVLAHGGRVEARSTDAGAVFRLRIPVQGQPPAVPAAAASGAEP